jgi:hypothetical protein
LEWFEFEPENFLTPMRTRRCSDAGHSLPGHGRRQIVPVANLRVRKVHDCELSADNPWLPPLRVHGRLNSLPDREYELFANVIVGVDGTRMRTDRGHGQFESVSGIEPVQVRGYAAFAAMSNSYCEAVSGFHRDRFAAMKTLAC